MANDPMGAVLRHLRTTFARQAAANASDAELLARFVGRCDEAAFAALVERHGGLVLQVCRRVLDGGADADDAFQATFLVLARKAAAIRKRASLAAWLHGVAFRSAMNLRKSAMRRNKYERCVPSPRPESPAAIASLNELQRILDEEIQSLSEPHRAAFVVCCLEGRSRRDAAQTLGWNEGTLASRLAKAREVLQKRLLARGVSLPVALGAIAVSPATSSAISTSLLNRTVEGGVSFASGTSASASIPGAIAKAVLKGMPMGKLKVGVLLTITSLVAVAAGGAFVAQPENGKNAEIKDRPNAVSPVADKSPDKKILLDDFGDPLPEGAIARLGTTRLRTPRLRFAEMLPDNKRIVTLGDNALLRLWDADTGKLLQSDSLGQSMQAMALSHDGKKLAVAGASGVVLWDAEKWKLLHHYPPRTFSQGQSIDFSPDGKTCIFAQYDGALRVFDLTDGSERTRKLGCGVRGIVIEPESRKVIAVDTANTVHVVELATLETSHFFNNPKVIWQHSVYAIPPILLPDGKTIAVGAHKGVVDLFDWATGKKLRSLGKPDDVRHVGALRFLPGDKELRLLLGELKGGFSWQADVTRRWDVATWNPLPDLPRGQWTESTSLDGRTDLRIDRDAVIPIDRARGKPRVDLVGHRRGIQDMAFSREGSQLAVLAPQHLGHSDDVPDSRVWDIASKKARFAFVAERGGRVVSCSEGFIVSESEARFLRLLDPASGKELRRFDLGEELDTPITAVSSDGKRLLALAQCHLVEPKEYKCGETVVFAFDIATAKLLGRQRSNSDRVFIHFTPDGKHYFHYSGAKIIFRDFKSGDVVRQITMEISEYRYPIFSADSQLMAIDAPSRKGEPEGAFRVYEFESGKPRALVRAPSPFHSLAFSPDNRILAGHDNAGAVILLDAFSGVELWRSPKMDCRVSDVGGVAFAPDGVTMATGYSEAGCGILLWKLDDLLPRIKDGEWESAWDALASDDATRALRTSWALVHSPRQTAPLFRNRLKPAPMADVAAVRKLIVDLDSATFAVRETAMSQLKALGEKAEPAMRTALQGDASLELKRRLEQLLAAPPAPETLRSLRAIAVLERIGSADAIGILESLSKGAPGVRTTEEAAASLARVRARIATR
jgi:RNA polymerase sigma factor (sigma-70 family)